ncbi:hypothetical protein [Vibrio jasicida]|uniref:hypothetical protein n=1 Tax=Vibrio jasicida TaxID=766224 RepID=UPI00039B3FF2|nr:hypothetical protein [Vibrio jasicida]
MKKSLILTPVVMCFLSACNGGSGNDSSSNSVEGSSPETVNIETSPIQSKGLVSEEVAIDVLATNEVSAAMKVTSVRSISGDSCQVTSIGEQSFTTSSDEVGECQYEYTVVPQNSELYVGEESSIARVSVSETAADNTLPNLAETTDIDTPVVIDLSQELAEELDTSVFYLSSDASVLGAGIVDSDAANNVLTFTPFEVGVSRVTYSMTDGSVTKLGTIDVAVSDTQNTPPVALNYVREGKLDKGMLVTIDLTDYISDAEDAVILESVRAYNAETEITSASEHTFTFRSSEPGAHEVAYTINDGRGGYAVGQVYLEIEPDFSLVQDWDDVTVYDSTIGADITFTAPVSKVLADYTNTAYTNYQAQDGVTGSKGAEVVTMNLEQAQNYCATRNGRLPINREWELLIANQGNLFTSQNWPAGADFWSADMISETAGKSINATDGTISELAKLTGEGFVTCVLLDSEAVKDFSSEIEYVTRPYSNVSDVSLKVTDPDGSLAPYQNIEIISEREKGVFSNYETSETLLSDASGSAVTTYTDLSFNNEVISVTSSSNAKSSIAYSSKDAVTASTLPVNESNKWNRVAAESGTILPIDDIGIPSLYYGTGGSIRALSVFNERSFTGRNFIGYVKVKNFGEKDAISGKLSFIVQQVSIVPQSGWGDAANQPGSPRSNKAFEIVTNYWNERTQVFSGYGNSVGLANMNVASHERHIWFENNNGHFMVYSSETSDKPLEPAVSFNMDWAGMDPGLPYWVQISSRISRDGNSVGVMTYVTDAKFASFD